MGDTILVGGDWGTAGSTSPNLGPRTQAVGGRLPFWQFPGPSACPPGLFARPASLADWPLGRGLPACGVLAALRETAAAAFVQRQGARQGGHPIHERLPDVRWRFRRRPRRVAASVRASVPPPFFADFLPIGTEVVHIGVCTFVYVANRQIRVKIGQNGVKIVSKKARKSSCPS